jgi:hypothetical protein
MEKTGSRKLLSIVTPTQVAKPFAWTPTAQRVDPTVLQIILLDDIAQNTREMVEQQKAMVQAGAVLQLTLICGDAQQEATFTPYLFSMVVTNDGPGIAQIRTLPAGQQQTPLELRANEVANITFPTAVIGGIRFRGVAGATPTIRVMGTF